METENSTKYFADIKAYLKSLVGLKYLLVTEHIGQAQKHYHIFVQYQNSKNLSIRRLKGAHLERCYGSAQQNIRYCKAEDEKHIRDGVTAMLIEEEGEPVFKGGNFTIGYLQDCDNPDELPAVLYNTYQKIKLQKKNRLSLGSWRKEVKVYYIQGPSAIGKSERAEELIRKYYNDKGIEDPDEMYFDELKYDKSGFYSGITLDNPSEVAVFDDFRAGIMKPEEFINLIDYRVHNLNIKGGSAKNNYKLIIFTSVQKLSSIYRNVDEFERREQWERRIQLINMYPPERVHIGGLPVGHRTDFNQLEEYSVEDTVDNTRIVIN
ncbi:hypothetical protein BCR36DRAFT_416125 [Piromyces finnis]|uniref:Helicase superfamily 3 single-stranded DNA/RNA virus domain-containing protein n=1 Tax=Piromyces finnis TaxID=1754191 RepID=A0A1Y1UWE9_9FUNG|nr:hypothetical protein BCR36DRAFT_416125 [Piromyces finnis]|eukprot:ORX42374.1 hypothetical protein BCR36DRAFT_416125 [Piromyces finnis]